MPENKPSRLWNSPLNPSGSAEIAHPAGGVLRHWRERLLNFLLCGAAVAGLFALAASIIADIQINDWVDIAITCTAYGVLLAITFIRLPYRLRAFAFVVLMYAMLMNSLLSSGIRGDAPVFSLAFTLLTLMLLGVLAGWIALGVWALSISAVAWAVVTERLPLKELYDQLSLSVWIAPAFVILLIAVLLMLGVILLQREFLAAQGREKLAMEALIEDRGNLESRVSERTRELSLAADVGRSVSQLRDLDTLLTKAVELIRSQFSLYYAQIYLMDSTGRMLVLRAGTGGVGAELLRRGHRLPVGPGSINGVAAGERKAMIVADTDANPIFHPNPLLPETRSELAIPLLTGEKVVGVLDLQSRHPGALSEENLSVFEAVAGQLAIALDNATLFAQTEQARREVEEQTRRLTRTGWQEFLDALDRSERIGYRYDQDSLTPFTTPFPEARPENTVKTSIVVTGAPVGAIQLERAADQPWQLEEVELVTAVVDQASRQLDNLRLLAQAESYRNEAEDAARRLTREGWAEYLQTRPEVNGFVYNQSEVRPLDEAATTGAAIDGEVSAVAVNAAEPVKSVVQKLQVGFEMVGELSFDGVEQLDTASNELVGNVANLLSSHIEGLRLTEQTQKALIETEELYSASAELNTARTYEEILGVLRRHSLVGKGAHAVTLSLFNRPWSENDMPEWVETAAVWNELSLEGLAGRFPLATFPSALAILHPDYPTLVEDVMQDTRLDEAARRLYFQQYRSHSAIFIPLVTGGQWIGTLYAGYGGTREFLAEAVRRALALAGQAAVAVNNLRLLDETQALAQREKDLRQITALVRGSTNADTILRTATRELGTVLGRKVKVQLGEKR